MNALLFIDTNIFLDFYRVSDAGLSLLRQIDENHDRIITGSQVEMEFKKNRQSEVLKVLEGFKSPDWKTLTVPAFLANSKTNKAIVRRRREIERHSDAMRRRIQGVFRHPSRFDPVYRSANSLFQYEGPCNLSRKHTARSTIRRLAWKRFALGYPPRKAEGTSTGDAINWEWTIRCATETGKDIVIVSRDSDYGVRHGKEPYLNDWLLQEFRERVSKRRQINLTRSLSEGFKRASVPVTRDQERAERQFLDQIQIPKFLEPIFDVSQLQLSKYSDPNFVRSIGTYLLENANDLSEGTPRNLPENKPTPS